jgi:hypothetical protein
MFDDIRREVLDRLPGSAIALLAAFCGGFLTGQIVRLL